MKTKVPLCFYLQNDVVHVAKTLLGKYLFTKIDAVITGGVIVETESYGGIHDRACHAYQRRYTPRTKTLYERGGVAYVYLCYGIHHLLNVVTNTQGIPHAVLIRAIQPVVGMNIMMKRRKKNKIDFSLTSGPGALTQALGITQQHNGHSFLGSTLWIEETNKRICEDDILEGPRVGVAYAQQDALLPWRFRIKNNPWASRAK